MVFFFSEGRARAVASLKDDILKIPFSSLHCPRRGEREKPRLHLKQRNRQVVVSATSLAETAEGRHASCFLRPPSSQRVTSGHLGSSTIFVVDSSTQTVPTRARQHSPDLLEHAVRRDRGARWLTSTRQPGPCVPSVSRNAARHLIPGSIFAERKSVRFISGIAESRAARDFTP